MSAMNLQAFGGMLPAVDNRLLPDTQASYLRDGYLYAGTLLGWRTPTLLFNLGSASTRFAYRVPARETDAAITSTSYWLEFADVDTTVLRTPVIDDTHKRYYFASPSIQPRYNTTARIAANNSAWLLGVPAPANAPGVTPFGGSGTDLASARSYVYTFVTEYSEESAPSPPLVVNGYVDDVWRVTVADPPANDMGVDRNISSVRIYRTVTSSDGTATYFLVDEIDVGVLTYDDTFTDEDVAENIELLSTTWTPPPTDLQGMVAGANGMFVGWRENEVWFSEPFRPHAWPSVYTLTTEFPIVGLGAVGQSIVVVTKGYPVVLTGSAPDAITSQVIHKVEPCTARGSIVSATDAVYYISGNGLQAVTPYGTISNTTEQWIKRNDWHTYIPLNSARAVTQQGSYWTFGSVYVSPVTGTDVATEAQMGASVHSPQTSSQNVSTPPGGEIINPAFGVLTAPNALDIYNMMVDHWSGSVMLIQNQKVYYYNFADTAPTIMPLTWRSKTFTAPAVDNLSAMRVWFRVPTGTVAQALARNTASIQTLAADQYGIVRVYADDILLTTREIRTSGELLRIASGRRTFEWKFEIETRVEITRLEVASTVKELGSV